MFGGVIGKHPRAGAPGNRAALALADAAQGASRIFGRLADDDLPAGPENRFKAFPVIADDRHAARGRFKETHARGITSADHVRSRQIQREALRRVEIAVFPLRHVLEPIDVGRPLDFLGVGGTCQREAARWQLRRGLQQERLNADLPVGAGGTVAALVCLAVGFVVARRQPARPLLPRAYRRRPTRRR